MAENTAAPGKKLVTVYTDGACLGNPGPGGWSAILVYGKTERELSGSTPATTNNRMELMAPIEALSALKEPCIVHVFSDSQYVVRAFQNSWIFEWERQGWRKADRKPVQE